MAKKTNHPLANNGGGYLSAAIRMGLERYPEVLQKYIIDPEANIQDSTSEKDYPLSKLGKQILPHLLTRFLAKTPDDDTDNGAPYEGNISNRMPIKIEIYGTAFNGVNPPTYPQTYEIDSANSKWGLSLSSDQLSVDADGSIWVRGLALAGQNYALNIYGAPPDFISYVNEVDPCSNDQYPKSFRFIMRPIRMTVAIPLDHRITSAIKIGSDPTNGIPVSKGLDDQDTSDRMDVTVSRLHMSILGSAAKKELRFNSYPIPASCPTPGKDSNGGPDLNLVCSSGDYPTLVLSDTHAGRAPDKPGAAGNPAEVDSCLVNDQAYLDDQVKRALTDYGRVVKACRLIIPHICPTIYPGQEIGKVGDITVNAVVTKVQLKHQKPQETVVYLE